MLVYLATNKANGKGYVGLTARSLRARIKEHRNSAGKLTTPFARALNKYGLDAFVWETIAECCDAEAMGAAEEFYIRTLRTFVDDGTGYNRTRGGGGTVGWVPTQETRAKMSASAKAAKPRTIKHQLMLFRTGHTGRTHSAEARAKMSTAASNPERVASFIDRTKEHDRSASSRAWCSTPEGRAHIERMRNHEGRKAAAAIASAHPDARAKHAEGIRRYWENWRAAKKGAA
jgi:group I intron endonuclease